MLRLSLKKLFIGGVLLFLVLVLYNADNNHDNPHTYTQRELIEKMNVYDEFGQLSEKRQREMENFRKENGLELKLQMSKSPVNDLKFQPKGVDYNKYTDILSLPRPKYLPNYKNPCWEEKTGNRTKIRCLPYFLILGVDKCGTTDLWARIEKHPEVVRNNGIGGKETHWWSWRRFGFDIWVDKKTPWTLENYLSVFDDPAKKIESVVDTTGYEDDYHPYITGEGSPTVFWDFTGWDHMPQNDDKTADNAVLTPHAIKHLAPKTMFILIFRNPTDRLYSDYLFLDLFRPVHKISAENFHHGVIQSIQMFHECKTIKSMKGCLYDKHLHMKIPVRIFVGMYVVYLKEWFKVFDSSQFLILKNEEYSKDIKRHVLNVFRFLDLKTVPDDALDKIVDQGRAFDQSATKKKAGPMWEETRAILNSFYKQYNEELVELLGSKKYLWNDS